MVEHRYQSEKGQVIIMVSLALFAMMGLLGLAIDVGWSAFVRRSAQTAADASALAAAEEALSLAGVGSYICGSGLTCEPTPIDCPASVTVPATNLEYGCAYAIDNGFTNSGDQTVTIQSDVALAACADASPPNCIPTAPGVVAQYWVTVRVTQTVPQLFSRVFGNNESLVSARATAAIADSVSTGSLILINRKSDPVGGTLQAPDTGVDLQAGGGGDVIVPGGVTMASRCAGDDCPDHLGKPHYAGELGGSGKVTSPFTYITDQGMACASNILECGAWGGSSIWDEHYTNGWAYNNPMFLDPMRGKWQPPPPPAILGLPEIGVPLGVLPGSNDPSNPAVIPPGIYYASDPTTGLATGEPIRLSASQHYAFGTPGEMCSQGAFNNYVFFGGMATGGDNTVQFTPGRYVFAGQNDGDGGALFGVSNRTTLYDCLPIPADGVMPTQNLDAGEIFIFTDLNYPGLQVPTPVQTMQSTSPSPLTHGQAGFKMGNNVDSVISLHGLNDQHQEVINAGLDQYSPVLLWQDQANASILYTPEGNIDTSCGDMENPCQRAPAQSANRQMYLHANAGLKLYGAVYVPRGAWLHMHAGSDQEGPLQIIAGALTIQGSPQLKLTGLSNPITRRIAALVE